MDAVGMLENWPDQDIIDVFKQMDKDAEEEGKPTITNYLLSLLC
jgi:flagellar protein FlbB